MDRHGLPPRDDEDGACGLAMTKMGGGGAAPIPLEELIEVARVTIEAAGG